MNIKFRKINKLTNKTGGSGDTEEGNHILSREQKQTQSNDLTTPQHQCSKQAPLTLTLEHVQSNY